MKKIVKAMVALGIINVLLTIFLCLLLKGANLSEDIEDETNDRFCKFCPNEEYL